MARRVVNGNSFSENGWPLVDQAGCKWVTVPGTSVRLQIQDGPPAVIMTAWAADWHAYIEPLRDADSACWTEGNSVLGQPGKNNGSNHLGGTAEDLNWNSHPFQKRGSLNAAQMQTLAEMEQFYEGNMFWAGRWNQPVDEMHSQMGYDTYDQDNDRPQPKVFDFINRKIRPDGFSTFRRGAAPAAPAGVDVLRQAMGNTAGVDYGALLPAVTQCLQDCGCTTVNRIAMWMAQVGHESAGLKYMEEIASGAAYEGRGDLGNTQPGDGVRFKGRGPIQVTGRRNYTVLSQWAFGKGLVPSPTFFVDQPPQLASTKYGFIGVTWYWTTQRPMNDAADARDIVRATQYVNGGQNGIDDRRARYSRALAMGDQLLALTNPVEGDDELSAEAERMIRELYDEYKANRRAPSRSFFAKDQVWGETPLGFEWNMDGNINELYMTWGYLLGVSSIEADVEYIAANGVAPESWAGSLVDGSGKKWLAEVGQQWCQGLVALRAAMQKAFKGNAPQAFQAAAEPQVVYVDRQVPAPVPTGTVPAAPLPSGGSTGQIIGRAYDALQELRLADALPIEDRAPLAALIAVLQTKNGSELK